MSSSGRRRRGRGGGANRSGGGGGDNRAGAGSGGTGGSSRNRRPRGRSNDAAHPNLKFNGQPPSAGAFGPNGNTTYSDPPPSYEAACGIASTGTASGGGYGQPSAPPARWAAAAASAPVILPVFNDGDVVRADQFYRGSNWKESRATYLRLLRDAPPLSSNPANSLPRDVVARYTDWYFRLGVSSFNCADYGGAGRAYTSVLHYAPDHSQALINRAGAVLSRGSSLSDYRSAIKDLDVSIKLRPNDMNAYWNRANANERLGRIDAARADWQLALKCAWGEDFRQVRGLVDSFESRHRKVNPSLSYAAAAGGGGGSASRTLPPAAPVAAVTHKRKAEPEQPAAPVVNASERELIARIEASIVSSRPLEVEGVTAPATKRVRTDQKHAAPPASAEGSNTTATSEEGVPNTTASLTPVRQSERKTRPPPPNKPLVDWSSGECEDHIRSIGPPYGYAATLLRDQCINGLALAGFTDDLFRALGIENAVHRHRIMTEINHVRSRPVVSTAAPAPVVVITSNPTPTATATGTFIPISTIGAPVATATPPVFVAVAPTTSLVAAGGEYKPAH